MVSEEPSPAKAARTEYQELRIHLEEKKTHNDTVNNSDVPATSVYEMIQRDMASYESRGKRPPGLEQLYSALLSIPPTSAEVTVALHCHFEFFQIHEQIWPSSFYSNGLGQ